MWDAVPPRLRRWPGRQAAAQAIRSASGHSSSGRDRIALSLSVFAGEVGPFDEFCDMAQYRSSRLGDERHVFSHEVTEPLVGVHGFEPAVELDGWSGYCGVRGCA